MEAGGYARRAAALEWKRLGKLMMMVEMPSDEGYRSLRMSVREEHKDNRMGEFWYEENTKLCGALGICADVGSQIYVLYEYVIR